MTNNKEVIIRDADKEDAAIIADAILEAVGEEIVSGLAGEDHSRESVHLLFKQLAERENTQYSYQNTRIAEDDEGNTMGVCISYDGAHLIPWRREFFYAANKLLGWKVSSEEMDSLPGETDSGEFYLDTLTVLPEYRRRGVAKALIRDAKKKAEAAGKPLGLLCDIDNEGAYQLYTSLGFKKINQRPFAGHLMNHLMWG